MARIAEKLRDAPPECEDYVEYLCEIVEGADDGEVDDATFEAAFRFMERNAAAELGSPGPLVHFLERFYPRYLSRLVESVRRCPTFMTMNAGRLGRGSGMLLLTITLGASCTDRHATPSEDSSTSEAASTASGDSATTSSSGGTSAEDTTGPGFDCITELGPDPDADPDNWEGGTACAQQTEATCSAKSEPVPCTPLYGRRLSGCAAEGVPECESPESLEYLGCIAFTICKNGVNFYSDGHAPPAYYATTSDCLPYGFERCDVPGFNPDPESGDGLPPTCGAWW